MSLLNFPTSPSLGDTYSFNGRAWRWNGEAWEAYPTEFAPILLGNITNDGAIGSTANLPIITTTDGVLTTGVFGDGENEFCEGNDARVVNSLRVVNHGTVASTARPAGAAAVYWVGSVEPTNALDGDLWNGG